MKEQNLQLVLRHPLLLQYRWLGRRLRDAALGSGFSDFVLRFYAQHVFLLPIVMLGLMAVHFPRFLVFDVPMVMAIGGAILITGGVFPIDMGFKFEPTVPPGVTVPEWYLTGIYAFHENSI